MCVKAMLIVTFDKLWQSLLTNPRQLSQLRSSVWILSRQVSLSTIDACLKLYEMQKGPISFVGPAAANWECIGLFSHMSHSLHSLPQETCVALNANTLVAMNAKIHTCIATRNVAFIATRNMKSSIDIIGSKLPLECHQNQNEDMFLLVRSSNWVEWFKTGSNCGTWVHKRHRWKIYAANTVTVGISKCLWGSPRELLWALPAPRYRGGQSHPETTTLLPF